MTYTSFGDWGVEAYLCDTARIDSEGKVNLIGILPGIVEMNYPVICTVGVFVHFPNPPEPGTPLKVDLSFTTAEGQIMNIFELISEVPASPEPGQKVDGTLRMVLDKIGLNLGGPGALSLRLAVGEGQATQVAGVTYR